jgi:hypothetical protein
MGMGATAMLYGDRMTDLAELSAADDTEDSLAATQRSGSTAWAARKT